MVRFMFYCIVFVAVWYHLIGIVFQFYLSNHLSKQKHIMYVVYRYTILLTATILFYWDQEIEIQRNEVNYSDAQNQSGGARTEMQVCLSLRRRSFSYAIVRYDQTHQNLRQWQQWSGDGCYFPFAFQWLLQHKLSLKRVLETLNLNAAMIATEPYHVGHN